MKLYGIGGKDVARKLGLSPRTVWVVLGGYGASARVQRAIVQMIRKHDDGGQFEGMTCAYGAECVAQDIDMADEQIVVAAICGVDGEEVGAAWGPGPAISSHC
jgi:hypothetical protein